MQTARQRCDRARYIVCGEVHHQKRAYNTWGSLRRRLYDLEPKFSLLLQVFFRFSSPTASHALEGSTTKLSGPPKVLDWLELKVILNVLDKSLKYSTHSSFPTKLRARKGSRLFALAGPCSRIVGEAEKYFSMSSSGWGGLMRDWQKS